MSARRAPVAPRVGAWPEDGGGRFRVWAPGHARVELVLFAPDGETVVRIAGLAPEPDGYFTAHVADAAPGTLYKYRVDAAGPFPDPASRAQPRGVHGASQVIDTRFAWTDAAWRGVALADMVLYEVHVGTATPEGTFEGLIPRLAELRALGVTALELMPVASFPGRHNWGYDGVSLYAPSAAYGGPTGLRKLIDAAHAAGLGVLIDVVYNHLGPDGNYLAAYADAYFTDRHTTPWGAGVNVDGAGAAPVREFLLANAEMWVRDFHADGLRLDATHAIHDDGPEHLLAALARRARAAAPERHVVLVAEDERNDARLVTPAAQGGYGLDAVWADDFHHQVHRALTAESEGYYRNYEGTSEHLAATLRRNWFFRGQRAPRDERPRGTDASRLPPARFVYCLQNHDQVGNRALGERLGALVTPAAYRAASALLLLGPHTPLLFMGQEWNATAPFQYFTDHHRELGGLVTEGRMREFRAFAAFRRVEIPDPQAPATFERSRLDWTERERAPHAGVLAWYHALLALRATHPALAAREHVGFDVVPLGAAGLALRRRGNGRELLLVVSLKGSVEHALDAGARWRVVAHSDEPRFGGTADVLPVGADGVVHLAGPSAVVLEPAE